MALKIDSENPSVGSPVNATVTHSSIASRLARVIAAAAFMLLVMTGISNPAHAASGSTRLLSGEALTSGQALMSFNQKYLLVVQGDGNVVLYGPNGPKFNTASVGANDRALVMQGDGNLVLYGSGGALWSTGTHGFPGAFAELQDDGNLVIITADGRPVWSFNVLQSGNSMPSAQVQSLSASNSKYQLVMQNDGNLVVYGPNGAIFATNTFGSGRDLVMQTDGNLVIYAGGRAVWASGTSGHTNAYLMMQNDGNIVIYTGDRALWSSFTGLIK